MTGKPQRRVVWFVAGLLASAIPLGLYWLKQGHHYKEEGTFYRGTMGDQQVVGIAFVEFDGLGFMELTQWKVQLVSRSGEHMTVYQKSSVFQEEVPHQPKIEISGRQIYIDDGELPLSVTVQDTRKG
ncbi:MAG: hypothetical protein J0L73_22390 [Verrucomicrobia bacterium]|nr:hypothetical protein [Verrucomicrobiota bacterium]